VNLAEGLSRCGIGGQAATDRHHASQRPAFSSEALAVYV